MEYAQCSPDTDQVEAVPAFVEHVCDFVCCLVDKAADVVANGEYSQDLIESADEAKEHGLGLTLSILASFSRRGEINGCGRDDDIVRCEWIELGEEAAVKLGFTDDTGMLRFCKVGVFFYFGERYKVFSY